MRILSLIPDVQSLAHEVEGKIVEFTADDKGGFEVPEQVGRALIGFPHWVQDLGQEAEKAVDAVEGDVHAELAAAREEIAKLKAQLAGKKPAKAAAPAKPTAPPAPAAPAAPTKDAAPSA